MYERHLHRMNIRTDQAFLDSYKSLLYKTTNEIKNIQLDIRFHGRGPATVSEWFAIVFAQMFDPNFVLFTASLLEHGRVHPNSYSGINPEHLNFFKLAGRITGMAIRESEVLPRRLTKAMLRQIQGDEVKPLSTEDLMEDLKHVDEERYSTLTAMLESHEAYAIGKTFSINIDKFGVTETIDLVDNGRNIPVTGEHKEEYVRLVAEYVLERSVKDQLDTFAAVVHDVLPPESLLGWSEEELDRLFSGLWQRL